MIFFMNAMLMHTNPSNNSMVKMYEKYGSLDMSDFIATILRVNIFLFLVYTKAFDGISLKSEFCAFSEHMNSYSVYDVS